MLKKTLYFIWLIATLAGLYWAFKYFTIREKKNHRDAYYNNLQDTSSPTVETLRDSFLIGYQNDKRSLYIYVPPDYEKDSTQIYPVIYMMDGESCFNDLDNMADERF